MKKNRIPTILGIIILIIGIGAGVLLIQNSNIFKLGASAENAPKDVRISNITNNSFTVSWTTDKELSGFVKWGESDNSLNSTEQDEFENSNYTHTVTIRGLNASSTYYFSINSGGSDFDNNGVSWSTKTGVELTQPKETILVSGTVLSSTGTLVENALVYANIGGASTMSTVTSQSGSWVIPLSSTRANDLNSYYLIDKDNDVVEVSVLAGPRGTSSAQIYPRAANPSPPLVLGQVHDFRNLTSSYSDDSPEAILDLPETDTMKESAFNVDEEILLSESSVTLESIKEGEVITTSKPEFFGEGPEGTDITITIESDLISGSVTIDSNGDWSWNPPETLESGLHIITLNWEDDEGILQSITKSFIVQAADDGLAFESTPSAQTPSPTPTSTPTPRATITPLPTATPRVTATPSVSPTPQPIPDSGSLTPTIMLIIMGLGLLFTSSLVTYLSHDKK